MRGLKMQILSAAMIAALTACSENIQKKAVSPASSNSSFTTQPAASGPNPAPTPPPTQTPSNATSAATPTGVGMSKQQACEITLAGLAALGVDSHTCPSNCRQYPGFYDVTGSEIDTVNSSLCGAAVHAGKINDETGGTIDSSEVYALGEFNGGFTASSQYGVQTKASSVKQLAFSFTITSAENIFWRQVYTTYMGSSALVDAASMQQTARNRKYNGCVSALSSLIRNNVGNQPWNTLPYIAGVQGVGPGNSSYNYGFMTMSYAAIFGFAQSPESVNYWLPRMNSGELTAWLLSESFLADVASVNAHCLKYGM